MKISIKMIALIVATYIVAATSCSKDKTNDPITDFSLKGDSVYTIPLNTKFKDPGVIATLDEKDITDQVMINNKVDTMNEGSYKIYYVIKGKTDTLSRRIVVANEARYLLGKYKGDYNYLAAATKSYNDSILIDKKINNKIYLKNFANYSNINIPAFVKLKTLQGDILQIDTFRTTIDSVKYTFVFDKAYFKSQKMMSFIYTEIKNDVPKKAELILTNY